MRHLIIGLFLFSSFAMATPKESAEISEIHLNPGSSVSLEAYQPTRVTCDYHDPTAPKCTIENSKEPEYPWRVMIDGKSMGRVWKYFDDAMAVIQKLQQIGQCR